VSWELGEHYDRGLSSLDYPLGPGWLDRLGGYRGEKLRLHDPSFVFGEPEFHPDSVTWRVLPQRTPVLVGQLTRARRTRNFWEHQAVEQDLNRFGEGVRRYRELAESLGLTSVVDVCNALIGEVKAIRSRGGAPAPSSTDVVKELQSRLDDAGRAVEEARRELNDGKSEQARLQGDQEHKQGELEQLVAAKEEQLLQAQSDLTQVREQLQLMRQEIRLNAVEEAEGLNPGEPWRGGLGARVLFLKPRMRDLIDPVLQVLLSDELGPVAQEAALRWLAMAPDGGQVYLTAGGHAAIQKGHSFLYLGQLDTTIKRAEEDVVAGTRVRPKDSLPGPSTRPGTDRPPGTSEAGYLLRHQHEITADGRDVFQYTTERLLSSVLGAVDAESVAAQLCGDLEPGEQFRVTKDGSVVINRGGQYLPVSQVDLDYWFRWGETPRF
jgi:hypothetical protein